MKMKDNRLFHASAKDFAKIPGSPIAYWVSEGMIAHYLNNELLGNLASPCAGLATGDNELFQRFWFEVNFHNIGFGVADVSETLERKERWYPCNSGGEFRKWYPKNEIVVNWECDGAAIKALKNKQGKFAARPQNTHKYFKEGFTWNKLSTSRFAVRYKGEGAIFDDTSRSAFPEDLSKLKYYIGFLCSSVAFEYLKALNPTMSFTNSDLTRLPILESDQKTVVIELVSQNIQSSSNDDSSFETSWDFKRHPLIRGCARIEDAFAEWEAECMARFNAVKANEEELNRIFIEIYGLQGELSPEVDEKDVTVRKADLAREIRSLVSYAVGCMFGRYSLDAEGLQFAGGEWRQGGQQGESPITNHQSPITNHQSPFTPDSDGIIPVTDDEKWFADDVVVQFRRFLEAAFGKETLDENLAFVERVLGKDIRKYFARDFYKDHVQRYQKRPIYWMFASPKGHFQALVYLHRYTPDLPGAVLNDYVRKFVAALTDERNHCESESARLASDADNAESQRRRAQLGKDVIQLSAAIDDLAAYDRDTLYHLAAAKPTLDLDDGVKVNYLKLGAALKDIGLAAKGKNK